MRWGCSRKFAAARQKDIHMTISPQAVIPKFQINVCHMADQRCVVPNALAA